MKSVLAFSVLVFAFFDSWVHSFSSILGDTAVVTQQQQASHRYRLHELRDEVANPYNESKMKIQAVLFDLDGTLLDTEALSDKAMLHFYREERGLDADIFNQLAGQGYRLPWELKKRILGLRGAEWGPIVIEYAEHHWNIPPASVTVQDIWSGWERHLNTLCSEVEACSGAVALVNALAEQNVPLAIATSSRREAVTKKATNHGRMFAHIPTIVAGDHPAVKNGKPAPDIYLEAARQLGVDPTQCLVVEDALSGVRAGKAAGCTVVAVPDPRFTKDEKAVFETESDYVLESLCDFEEKVDLGFELKINGDSST